MATTRRLPDFDQATKALSQAAGMGHELLADQPFWYASHVALFKALAPERAGEVSER